MKLKTIKNEEEYKAALSKAASFMDASPGSDIEADLEMLSLLIEGYEQEHFPIDAPKPMEAIRLHMEQQGLQPDIPI